MKILHLTLKKKWYDMIASGEKKEEYREIKRHWESRLCCHFPYKNAPKDFDVVTFIQGYQPDSLRITLEWKGTEIRTGKAEWGAEPDKEYFVIKLGEIIK